MPLYRVEINRTVYYTLEEIEAHNEREAIADALIAIECKSDEVIQDQSPDQDIEVFEIRDY